MDKHAPFFSVIIPCFNNGGQIAGALESLRQQSETDFEVICVLDGGSDNTAQILREWLPRFQERGVRLRVIENAVNGGPAKARNDGWRAASGRYVAFLDADDTFLPEKLAVVRQHLEDLQYPLAFGHAVESVGPALSGRLQKLGFAKFLLRNRIFTPCLIVSRSCELRFDESMRYCEDYDLLLRLSYREPIAYLNAGLTRLGRAPLTRGGASGRHALMRLGEMRCYAHVASLSLALAPAVPFLFVYSVLKYFRFLGRRLMTPAPKY